MQRQEEVPLVFQKIDSQQLLKGDIILHEGQLWQCSSKHMQLFLNLDSRQQSYIKLPQLLRVPKLQLIPREWKVAEGGIVLKGQQLGLGPTHQLRVNSIRQFNEMQVIKSEMAKGRRLEYKVVLCQTKVSKHYLLVAIQFL